MNRIWVAICHDRHTDHEVTLHRTFGDAMAYARAFMNDHVLCPEELEETLDDEYFALSYEEGDYAVVEAVEFPSKPYGSGD